MVLGGLYLAAPACLEDRNFDRCGGSRAHLPRCARGLCRGCSGGSGGGNHVGRPYELVGDASFTLSELVSLASEAAGKPIAYKNMRLDDLKEAAIRAGLPEMFAIMLSNTDAGMANGALFENGGELARLIGRPTTPVQSTIRSFYTEPSVAAAGRSLIRVAATQMVQAAEVTSARRTSVMKTVFAPAFLVDGDGFNYADEQRRVMGQRSCQKRRSSARLIPHPILVIRESYHSDLFLQFFKRMKLNNSGRLKQ